jgi:NAD(P)-dependent dehydrogenase (short-subunit alcohol dehydrogenase family)/uncharacterized membrane protein
MRRPEVVVVTGGSAGVGRAAALAFAQRGDRVAILAREPARVEAACEELRRAGAIAIGLPVDVADAQAVEAAAERVERELGPITVWVNGVSTTVFAPVDETTPDEFRRVTEVAYLGTVNGTLAALRRMRARNAGVIVQVGSALAYRSIPLQSSYCGAKAAIRGFTDSLRSELIHANSNVRVTMVQLSAFNTPQFDWARSKLPRRVQPLPPIFQPELAADAIVLAATRPQRETWVGWPAVKAILSSRVLPDLGDRLAALQAHDGQQTQEPAAPRPDNLFEPVPGDYGAHGRFDARSRDSHWQWSLSRLRWPRDARAPRRMAHDGSAQPQGEARSHGEHGHGMPDVQKHEQQMRGMHFDMLWAHWLNIVFGVWLLLGPLAFGMFDPQVFGEPVLRVTAERGLADPLQRMAWLGWSDIASGALVMLFGALSLSPRFAWAQWANAAVGSWLMFAPLVFWSPSAAVYNNDTMVGALVIAFAILVPMMPGMSHASMMDESDLPLGWSYSPSTYLQRLPIIALGVVGFAIARQLTAYQLGHADGVWEPFFAGGGGRDGTETIITSDVSKAWPIADAGLGAVSYLFEVLMGVMGDRRRWRTMPWMVAAFGVVVVPLGVVSIYFIVIQPIAIGTWCTLCLLAALAMLVMIPYTLDELVAMGQYLLQSRRRGEPFWRTFFTGGASPGSGRDRHPGFDAPLRQAARSALRGVTLPWTLAASALLGAALMLTRPIFGTEPPMAHSDHLVGALIVTVSVMAMAEVARPLRFINIPFGLWLVASPWLLDGASAIATAAAAAIGGAVLLLSLPSGARSDEQLA